VGVLFRRCEMYPHQSLHVVKTTNPFVIEERVWTASLVKGTGNTL
jgi:hypothetical protein